MRAWRGQRALAERRGGSSGRLPLPTCPSPAQTHGDLRVAFVLGRFRRRPAMSIFYVRVGPAPYRPINSPSARSVTTLSQTTFSITSSGVASSAPAKPQIQYQNVSEMKIATGLS